jgi:hypothetical protein
MSNDELLFLCELIKVEPDRKKKDLLFEEILNRLFEEKVVSGVGNSMGKQIAKMGTKGVPNIFSLSNNTVHQSRN